MLLKNGIYSGGHQIMRQSKALASSINSRAGWFALI